MKIKCKAIFMNHHVKGCKLSWENLGKGDHHQGNASFQHTGPKCPFIRVEILQRTLLAICQIVWVASLMFTLLYAP